MDKAILEKLLSLAYWCDNVSEKGTFGPDHPFFSLDYYSYEFEDGARDNKWEITVFLPPHGGDNKTDDNIRAEHKDLDHLLTDVLTRCQQQWTVKYYDG